QILCVAAAAAAGGSVEAATCPIAAQVSARHPNVVLGEPIDLTLVLRNTAAGAIELPAPSEKTGNVRLSIAEDANPPAFRPYNGPEWGTKDARRPPVRLKKGGSLRLNLRVLSNGVPRAARPDPKEISTPFAFGAAGRFVARVRYDDRSSCPDQPVEATVPIQVAAPAGEDMVVWDRIKTCAACALLLHTAELDPNDRASQDAVALFRQIVAQHPRTRYAKSMRTVLSKIDSDRGDSGNYGDEDDGG
ncbi:MAG TPA: hypothetical protein VH475_08180, partial [Tepidisphaeraceae bacterium]